LEELLALHTGSDGDRRGAAGDRPVVISAKVLVGAAFISSGRPDDLPRWIAWSQI
jgi:hypothetical protein